METANFTNVWNETASGLTRNLRSLGVPSSDVEDVLQTTAERALANGIDPAGVDHFRAWCFTVARHIAVDEWRKTNRVSVGEVPDVEDTRDIADEVAARQALEQFRREVRRLPRAERGAIISMKPAADRRAAGRVAVARHRARRKLAYIMEALATVATLAQIRMRRVGSPRSAAAAAMVAAASVSVGGGFGAYEPQEAKPSRVVGGSPARLVALGGGATASSATEPYRPVARNAAAARVPAADADTAPALLPAPPTVTLLPRDDGSAVVSGRPGRDEEEGIAVCTGTALTPYQCLHYPTLPGVSPG